MESLRKIAKQSFRCLVVSVRLRRAINKYLPEEDDPHIRKKFRQLSESFQDIKDWNLQLPETTAKSLADLMNSVESKRWKIQTVYGDSGIEYRDGETAADVASRMPAAYSVCYRVLTEIRRRVAGFTPTRVLDFGARTGFGFCSRGLAKVCRESKYSGTITINVACNDLIEGLKDLPLIHGYTSLLSLSQDLNKKCRMLNNKSDRKHELVIASYVLGEIPSLKDRITMVRQLWDLTDDLLVLVEPGTPHGANIISQMRWMENGKLRKLEKKKEKDEAGKEVFDLKSGAHIIAACPHDGKCLLENIGKYCHFVQRLQRTSFQRSYKRTKGVPLRGFEDEKFCFVVFRRGQRPREPWPLHRHLLRKGNAGRAFSGASDYREKLRSGLHSIRFEDALDLFSEMVHSQPIHSIVDFSRLLTSIAKMKRYETVIYLCKNLEMFGVSHDLYSFTIFIDCSCRCSRFSLALSLLGKMMKLGFAPSIVTLGSLLNGFCRSNKINEISSLIDSMKKSGYVGNVVIYNTLIHYLCKNSDMNTALEAFNKMEEEDVEADVVTYNTLISGLCSSGRWSEVARILRDVEKRRIKLDVVTFTALIDAFGKKGNVSEAHELYQVMITSSVDPNTITYNSLINGLCMHGCLYQARKAFDFMASKGGFRSAVTYNTLINGFCKSGRVDDGLKLFHRMRCEGLEGDTFTYNTLIHGFCQAGDLRAALVVFGWMVSCGVTPDIVTHCSMLHSLCVNGKIENAMVKFEDMRRSGKYLGIVAYNIMIHGLCKTGKVEEAWDMFCRLPSEGVKPDARTYTSMILGMCKNGPRREADELFRRMKEDGIICQSN